MLRLPLSHLKILRINTGGRIYTCENLQRPTLTT